MWSRFWFVREPIVCVRVLGEQSSCRCGILLNVTVTGLDRSTVLHNAIEETDNALLTNLKNYVPILASAVQPALRDISNQRNNQRKRENVIRMTALGLLTDTQCWSIRGFLFDRGMEYLYNSLFGFTNSEDRVPPPPPPRGPPRSWTPTRPEGRVRLLLPPPAAALVCHERDPSVAALVCLGREPGS